MKTNGRICLAIVLNTLVPCAFASCPAELTPAPIVSLALFKNGTAVVTRRIAPSAEGKPILLDGRVAPAHGTFWTDSPAPLSFMSAHRLVSVSAGSVGERPTRAEAYAGREATAWVRVPSDLAPALEALAAESGPASTFTLSAPPAGDAAVRTVRLRGTVLPPKKSERPESRRESFAWYGFWNYERVERTTPGERDGDFTLRLSNGTLVRVPEAALAAVSAEGGDSAEIPVFEVTGATGPFDMQYLARGAAWAPSYRLALGRNGSARLDMAAELRNEMEDLDGAEVFLVSGFPNVEAAEIPGLLATGNTVARFLDMLAAPRASHRARSRSSWTSQAAWTSNCAQFDLGADVGGSLPQIPSDGSSADIHYRSAGRVTLARGATLRLPLASAETPIARFVDWNPGYDYDEWGRRIGDGLEDERVPWDAVKFRNSLGSPITTGPISVFDGGRLNGQTTVRWTNPGQEATIRVTKALTVQGAFEETIPGRVEDYPEVHMLNSSWRRVVIEAKLTAVSHRDESVEVLGHPTITGEFQDASEEPASKRNLGSPHERGAVNPKQELRWEFNLAPGETKTLTWRYTTLIHN